MTYFKLYWLDNNYVQSLYAWTAPRLRNVAIRGLYWALVTLIDISLWLTDTTLQFLARDAHTITINAFAKAHDPLPEFPALPPTAVPRALPSVAPDPEAFDNVVPVLTLCPTVVPFGLI